MRLMIAAMIFLIGLGGAGSVRADWDAGWDAYFSGDYATALREWRPLAENGDARSQSVVGSAYLEGKGVPQNFKEAVKWFRRAAEQGYAKSQSNLGIMYALGNGVSRDNILAHMWLSLSDIQGSPRGAAATKDIEKRMTPAQIIDAQKLARECVKKEFKDCGRNTGAVSVKVDFDTGMKAYDKGDYATALREWRPLAEQGDALTQSIIGSMYSRGEGVRQDDKEAIKWYRRAAEQGYAMGQFSLGVSYEEGRGVLQNNREAVKWYRRAAEQGNDRAQHNLGLMYGNGTGVFSDHVIAHMWFSIAAKNGNKNGADNRVIAENLMTPAQIAKSQKLARECMAKKYKNCGP
jgi:uncharacterized protein